MDVVLTFQKTINIMLVNSNLTKLLHKHNWTLENSGCVLGLVDTQSLQIHHGISMKIVKSCILEYESWCIRNWPSSYFV
jgi:hypothetical protein